MNISVYAIPGLKKELRSKKDIQTIKDLRKKLKSLEAKVEAFQTMLKDIEENKKIEYNSHEELMTAVCMYDGYSVQDLKARIKTQENVETRQKALWLAKKMFHKPSYKTLGEFFHRDHATAIHANKTIENRIETDYVFRQNLKNMLNNLGVDYMEKGSMLIIIPE